MAQASTAGLFVRWLWNSSDHPFSSNHFEDSWRRYSDVETAVIEEAYQMKRAEAMLDKYHIDFEHSVQISNNNLKKQRPVKRITDGHVESSPRVERFTSKSIVPAAPFIISTYGMGGTFFLEVMDYCEVPHNSFPFDNSSVRRKIVEKAAEGLVIEGKKAGQQKVAEWFAGQLLKEKTGSKTEIWTCCARLYSMQSFLYKKLNEVMRLIGDPKYENVWRKKVSTFGPFALLFWKLREPEVHREMTVYRGANLSNDLIKQYKNKCVDPSEATPETTFMFPAYTSTSLNRDTAEQYGNVLFIITIKWGDGWNIAPHSIYNYEEEILLRACFRFNIVSCEFEETKNKWIVYLVSNQEIHIRNLAPTESSLL
ncbi:unnamed protein product [Adineta steineri]|uniref:NAD(P)(+)--arginine ADP-ribosyltransferase n=1 Tax=Adineta steineri TaxID=433720 RepID=A0A815DJH0_9BILA|nr:unnamed protein product [Adineta steineri]CAF3897789.1 unnamed protein product [Adineta steineri]